MNHLRNENTLTGMMFLLAAALYGLRSQYYWVGSINDDACYIVVAQSLLQGSYRALHIPGHPYFITYPPGFPLFLAPFVWLFKPHWAWLKIIPVVLTLLCGLLLRSLLKTWLRPAFGLFGLALFLFNPIVLHQSALVLSDPALLVLTLASCLVLRRLLLTERGDREAWILGCILGCSALVRADGFVLIGVFGGVLIVFRRRDAFRAGFAAILLGGCFSLRNYFIAGSLTGYATNWNTSLHQIIQPLQFLDNIQRVTNLFFVTGFLGIRLPYSSHGMWVSALLAAIVWLVIAAGIYGNKSSAKPQKILGITVIFLVVAFYAMHTLWTTIETNYAMPVLPFLAALAAVGAQSLKDRFPSHTGVWKGIGLIAVAGMITTNTLMFARMNAAATDPRFRFPVETWQWMNAHLATDARLVTALDAQTYIYTGRLCLDIQFCRDAEEFRYTLMSQGVTHVVTKPSLLQSPAHDYGPMWTFNQRWTASNPEAYRLLFRCVQENTAVYAVNPSTTFQTGYAHYLLAKTALTENRMGEGFAELDLALKADPSLVSALSAYGTASWVSGKNRTEGEQKLSKAVRMAPSHALAWLALGRVRRARGNATGADEAFRRSLVSISEAPEWGFLEPIIEMELARSRGQ